MARLQSVCLLIIPLLLVINISEGIFCSNKKRTPPHFGAFTWYSDSDPGTHPPLKERAPIGCKPIYINMVIRHGARYPAKQDYQVFKDLYMLARELNSTGKATICSQDLKVLRDWKLWMRPNDSRNQTALGDKEVEVIEQNFQRGFPEILSCSHNPDRYSFVSTNTRRTVQSMDRFAEKLLCSRKGKLPADAKLSVTPASRDPLVWANCPKHEREIRKNSSATVEFNKFLQGPQLRRVGNRIAKRLGIPRATVTSALLIKLHKGCYFEYWVTPKYAPWCRVFTSNDLEILEYALDLYIYEEYSYRYSLNYERSCFLSKEIVNSIKVASESEQKGEKYLLGKFRFAHGSTILPLATDFRLFKVDVPPTARNFNKQRNRIFKARHLIPSAANLAFVLYRCGNVTNTCYDVNDYMVQIYLNEKPVSIPACTPAKSDDENDKGNKNSKISCSLEKFLNYYKRFVAGSENECNQDEICDV